MLFVSLTFVLFMVVVFVGVWYANERSVGARNAALLFFSAVFYAWWDVRMLPILLGGTAIDYVLARAIQGAPAPSRRRALLGLGLLNSLGLLLLFKYFGFFIRSLTDSLAAFGVSLHGPAMKLIIPVGISFFALQRAGYLIDVYRKVSPAERNVVNFLVFASFFPIVLSGPIERSTTLLPQLRAKGSFDTAKIREGLLLFLWGAFKKIAVADSLARVVDRIFDQPAPFSGVELALGVALFSVQLYCDFSGYSEMAMGVGQVLGFRVARNFANPYFSRDIAEFWRRWHISLSSWLRDYVFFPLGAGYGGKGRWIFNTIVTFVLCGFWHGPSWTFIVWGALMGLYFVPLILVNPDPKRPRIVAKGRLIPTPPELLTMSLTFGLVTFSWIFFRSDTLPQAFQFVGQVLSRSWTAMPNVSGAMASASSIIRIAGVVAAVLFVLVLEWVQRQRRFALDLASWGGIGRMSVYAAIAVLLLASSEGGGAGFIYSQF